MRVSKLVLFAFKASTPRNTFSKTQCSCNVKGKEWIMNKSRFFLALLFVSLLFVLLPATAKADMWDVPVAPGETFRWVFVTSGTTNAESSEISFYNDFVNDAASIGTTITGVMGKSSLADIEWKAIGSTDTTDAIDNIGVSSSRIYKPDSTFVAEGTSDMFSGLHVNSPINIDETGTSVNTLVWTGSDTSGRGYDTFDELKVLGGSKYTRYGHTWSIDYRWIMEGQEEQDFLKPLYAISEELTVVPAPGALILAVTGLLSSTLGLKRLRRKHQE